jgi:Holliday junction resolvasome RuvABC endonuclease subunit
MKKLLGDIDLIVYEQPHQRGGHPTQVAMGLVAEVLSFAARANIETTTYHATALKKWATGAGNAKKEEMVKEATKRGYIVANDDEADAVLMLEHALDDLHIEKSDTARSSTTKSKLVRR